MDPHLEVTVNKYYELLLTAGWVVCALGAVAIIGCIALIVYERYFEGHEHAVQPERRVGPPDRRAHAPAA